jgi:hypothetical protein
MKHRNQQTKAQTCHEPSHCPSVPHPAIHRIQWVLGTGCHRPQPRFQLLPRSHHGGLVTHNHMQTRIPIDHLKHSLRLFFPPAIQPTGTQQPRRLGDTHGPAGWLLSAGG